MLLEPLWDYLGVLAAAESLCLGGPGPAPHPLYQLLGISTNLRRKKFGMFVQDFLI